MRSVPKKLSIGVEEEYLLVDQQTRGLIIDIPETLIDECNTKLKGRVSPEFLRSQVEVGTNVCHSIDDVKSELMELRQGVSEIANKYGLDIIASSTHPFSTWRTQKHTDLDRYNVLAADLQGIVRRLVICSMHVHVGIEDPDLRVDLMSQVAYFLPHLLALSTSSPFWEGEETGLKCYRLCIWNEFPRTGLPEQFTSWSEYHRFTDVLVETGCIEDATKIWWDIRPSARYPTVEMRITDVCSKLEDTLAITSLYACLMRTLYRLRLRNQRWRTYSPNLLIENKWRAQRYGLEGGLIDFGQKSIVEFKELLPEILELVQEDAEAMDCVKHVEHARTILKRGTSADKQMRTFEAAQDSGATKKEAFRSVVDMLIKDTLDFSEC